MKPRIEVPKSSVPRYVVTQLTQTLPKYDNGKVAMQRFRYFYIIDLHDRARVIVEISGGKYSVFRWSEAHRRATRIADKLNDRHEEAQKALRVFA